MYDISSMFFIFQLHPILWFSCVFFFRRIILLASPLLHGICPSHQRVFELTLDHSNSRFLSPNFYFGARNDRDSMVGYGSEKEVELSAGGGALAE